MTQEATVNTWGLEFTRVNVEENRFESKLSLNTGTESRTRDIFSQIKSEFERNIGEPDYVIDLLDDDGSVVDDHPVTEEQAVEISKLFGFEIK